MIRNKYTVKVSLSCLTFCNCSPWNSPGQNTGVNSLSLLQGIFPTQGLNPGLPLCRWILYQLSHKGSPRILEWVAYPFSSGNTQDRIIAILSGSRKTDFKFGGYVFLSQMILNFIFPQHRPTNDCRQWQAGNRKEKKKPTVAFLIVIDKLFTCS